MKPTKTKTHGLIFETHDNHVSYSMIDLSGNREFPSIHPNVLTAGEDLLIHKQVREAELGMKTPW